MDPDANLKEQREIIADILAIQDTCAENGDFSDAQATALVDHAQRLAELSQALDEWLASGGFLPQVWTRPVRHVSAPKPVSRRK